MSIRSISYGGGVQSTALLVLAAQGRIDFPLFLMANVGEDSEHPETLAYVRQVAKPYADKNGIELVLLDRKRRDGSVETLWGRLMDKRTCSDCKGSGDLPNDPDVKLGPEWAQHGDVPGGVHQCASCQGEGRVESRSLPIPVRMSNGAPGNRSCTADFKIKVIGKELRRRGATPGRRCRDHLRDDGPLANSGPRPDCESCRQPNIATIGIGISVDEIQRANARKVESYEKVVYPLIGIGEDTGLSMNRLDCMRVIRDAGLPVPPKSSCFFCPFHRPTAWADLARETPELFEKSVELENTLNERRTMLGKDPVFLTRFGIPLRDAIDTDQELIPLPDDGAGSCDSGWCFT